MKKEKRFFTDYATAANWGGVNLVLCNNIEQADQSIFDNAEFQYYNEDDDSYIDIYQWYITDMSEQTKNYMQETFDLLFTYSDLLDCFILCVPHCGTSWKGVECEVFSESWAQHNADKEFKL